MPLTFQSLIKASVIVFVIVFIYVTLAHYVVEWIKKLRGKKKKKPDKDEEVGEINWRKKVYQ